MMVKKKIKNLLLFINFNKSIYSFNLMNSLPYIYTNFTCVFLIFDIFCYLLFFFFNEPDSNEETRYKILKILLAVRFLSIINFLIFSFYSILTSQLKYSSILAVLFIYLSYIIIRLLSILTLKLALKIYKLFFKKK